MIETTYTVQLLFVVQVFYKYPEGGFLDSIGSELVTVILIITIAKLTNACNFTGSSLSIFSLDIDLSCKVDIFDFAAAWNFFIVYDEL